MDILLKFEPFLQDIVAVAMGDQENRTQVETMLSRLQKNGWMLLMPVQRIWDGERDPNALTEGLDPNSTLLIQRVLEIISHDPQTLINAIPDPVWEAIDDQDEVAFGAAMAALSPEERQRTQLLLDQLQVQADNNLQKIQTLVGSLPPAVGQALLSQDPRQLSEALRALPPEQAQGIMEQLYSAGLLADAAQAETERALQEFEPLLEAVAAVAKGNQGARPQMRDYLAHLEEQGWHLLDAVERIWAGERDPGSLTAGLDEQDAALVKRVLALIEEKDE
jgi:hypothetical protein